MEKPKEKPTNQKQSTLVCFFAIGWCFPVYQLQGPGFKFEWCAALVWPASQSHNAKCTLPWKSCREQNSTFMNCEFMHDKWCIYGFFRAWAWSSKWLNLFRNVSVYEDHGKWRIMVDGKKKEVSWWCIWRDCRASWMGSVGCCYCIFADSNLWSFPIVNFAWTICATAQVFHTRLRWWQQYILPNIGLENCQCFNPYRIFGTVDDLAPNQV